MGRGTKRRATIAAAALFVAGGSTTAPRAIDALPPPDALGAAHLTVLTYNVHGLPWPIARDRPADLALIGLRLRAMRAAGRQPRVVALQEAFTAEAQAIGRSGGDAHIVSGEDAERPGRPDDWTADRRWWLGETEGKALGSGLTLLSDYPVIAVRRLAYAIGDCAGFDCLANKGALLVRIAVDGIPVDVVTTHLNSRRASGTSPERADAAYRRQADELLAFVARSHDPRAPLIVAGDFNVGRAASRRAALLGGIARRWSADGAVEDALTSAVSHDLALPDDALRSRRRGKDWQFFASGRAARLDVAGIAVPFGRERDGGMLSDHVGWTAAYRLVPTSRDRSRV